MSYGYAFRKVFVLVFYPLLSFSYFRFVFPCFLFLMRIYVFSITLVRVSCRFQCVLSVASFCGTRYRVQYWVTQRWLTSIQKFYRSDPRSPKHEGRLLAAWIVICGRNSPPPIYIYVCVYVYILFCRFY